MSKRILMTAAAAVAALGLAGAAHAGPVFLTGHDPDFHAQGQASGVAELTVALNFVTGGTYNGGVDKFLFVESNLAVIGGHLRGKDSLTGAMGLTEGVNFDHVDAAGLAGVNFANYSAIVVASDFGGMLTDAEIEGLVARSNDIKTFVNGGGGLAAFAECGVGFPNCDSSLVNASTPLFGFVPIGVSSAFTTTPYTVTPYGASLGLTNADVDDCCTHNSFASAAGLNIVDVDGFGNPTTLAGNVRIGGGGFTGTPEPSTWALMIAGFGLAGAAIRRRSARLA
jgi:hypothetical protein